MSDINDIDFKAVSALVEACHSHKYDARAFAAARAALDTYLLERELFHPDVPSGDLAGTIQLIIEQPAEVFALVYEDET